MPLLTLTNIDGYARGWNDLQRDDGTGLHLGPGESAEVNVPDDLVEAVNADPNLKVTAAKTKPSTTSTTTSQQETKE